MFIDEKKCFECGAPPCYRHHVIPRSEGGRKTVRLCARCHGLVHARQMSDIRVLIASGIKRAQEKGVRVGRPPVITPELINIVIGYRQANNSVRGIARLLKERGIGVSRTTVERILKQERLRTGVLPLDQIMDDLVEEFKTRLRRSTGK